MTSTLLVVRTTSDPTRRRFCRLGAAGLLSPLVGCGSGGGTTSPSDTDMDTTGGGGTTEPDDPSTGSVGAPSGSDGTTATGGASSESGAGQDVTTASGSDGFADTTSGDTGAACEPTAADIEGPFYRPGIPIGGDLDVHGDTGVPLVLGGRVLDAGCRPIAGAVVEIWHATPVAPDGEPGDVVAVYDDTRAYRYYGQVATDRDGRYAFTTLKPGWYLNGAAYRPAHVHVKVWVDARERLTTQLYFVGDPFNADDPWFNPDLALDPDATGNVELDLVV